MRAKFLPALVFFLAGCGQHPTSDEAASPIIESVKRLPSHGLEFSTPTLDLGNLPIGTTHSFSTQLVNRGTDPTSVVAVTSGCGCINVKMSNPDLLPGQSALITGEIRVPLQPGGVQKRIQVTANGCPAEPAFCLLTCYAQKEIQVLSDDVILTPDFSNDLDSKSTVVLLNNSESPITVASPKVSTDGVHASLSKSKLGPKESCCLTISADPMHICRTEGEVIITTSHQIEQTVRVPFSIQPINGFACLPREIRLGVLPRKDLQNLSYKVVITGRLLRDLAPTTIDLPKFLVIADQPKPIGDRLEFSVKVSNDVTGFSVQGTLLVTFSTTNKSKAYTVRIPVSGLISG
jgi:hypothetical protein